MKKAYYTRKEMADNGLSSKNANKVKATVITDVHGDITKLAVKMKSGRTVQLNQYDLNKIKK